MAYEYVRENNLWDDECLLVGGKLTVDSNGVVCTVEEYEKQVYCRVGSVYGKEFKTAHEMGINAQWKLVISYADYSGETKVKYRDHLYGVYRQYILGDYIELYLRDDAGVMDGGSNAR